MAGNTGTQDQAISQVSNVVGTAGTPSLVLGAAAGTGATSSIIGTNMSGKITLNVGTGVLAAGIVLTMTFANSYAYPSGCFCQFSAGNTNFAAVIATLYVSSTSTTTVVLSVTAGLTISTTYIGHYLITGY